MLYYAIVGEGFIKITVSKYQYRKEAFILSATSVIKQRLSDLNKTQTELAETVGVTRQNFSNKMTRDNFSSK